MFRNRKGLMKISPESETMFKMYRVELLLVTMAEINKILTTKIKEKQKCQDKHL